MGYFISMLKIEWLSKISNEKVTHYKSINHPKVLAFKQEVEELKKQKEPIFKLERSFTKKCWMLTVQFYQEMLVLDQEEYQVNLLGRNWGFGMDPLLFAPEDQGFFIQDLSSNRGEAIEEAHQILIQAGYSGYLYLASEGIVSRYEDERKQKLKNEQIEDKDYLWKIPA